MTKLLIDTCVWLDIAKTSKGEEILNLLTEFIDNKEVEILLPEIIFSEFDRNKDRVIADAGKSLSSQFKKVKEMVAVHADEGSRQEILTKLNDIGIKLLISDTKKAESNFTEIQPNSTYIDLFDGEKYTITKKDVETTYSVELPNNKFLQVIAFQKSDRREIMKGYFKIQNSFSFFTGFSSPVLFRVSGNASGFNLNSISPSLGFNLVQMNINKERFDHISLDLLLTVTNYPQNLTDSYQYTLAAGGVIDFGGYIQVGSSYSFLEKRPYLVIGIKPYLFSKIFGNQ